MPNVAEDRFRDAVAGGRLDLPLPGHGRTGERLHSLIDMGRCDLAFVRLAEGHADAMAIRAELGDIADGAGRWGVWAAVPDSVRAARTRDRWRLTGDRPWCSGAACCTHALVTAAADDGIRLFAVDLRAPGVTALDGTWPAVGMAASDSRTVRFTGVPGRPVGGPGEYVGRPGFWHGGVGVAACWYGGALGVADRLLAAARDRDVGPHALAHLGAGSVPQLSRLARHEEADFLLEVFTRVPPAARSVAEREGLR